MLIPKAVVAVVAALCFGLAIAGSIYLVGSQFHKSAAHASHGEAGDHASKGRPAYVKEEVESYLEKIADPLVLLTLALCAITGGLAWYTRGLFGATSQMAKDAFNATHRPQLIIRDVRWLRSGEAGGRSAIAFTVINNGRAACTIVESSYELATLDEESSGVSLPTEGQNLIGRRRLMPGEFHLAQYDFRTSDEWFLLGYSESRTTGGERGTDVFFRGSIVYEDRDKVRRRYVFCRICRTSGERFWLTGHPEDEYTD